MAEERFGQDHWTAQLEQRLHERGFSSLTAFADAHPTRPLVELAEQLGNDFSAVHLFKRLVHEAERSHQVTRLVRGQFVRELHESFPDGWPPVLDEETRLEIALALGSWFGFTPVTHQGRVNRASDALLAQPPPPGWRPNGPDDALLSMLLPDKES
ncbi:NUDIX hydrolase [Archangium primigenium]|uniref:NUDIX hydrolase n=1 Tax=[Archangium] primigenium TaxID=2792470 RepID=UPI00195A74D3|nr:NUDIX hydrolase [Archangium primigenium]MBM7119185.1 NUDIX hydrolase [Archangium primigenium]